MIDRLIDELKTALGSPPSQDRIIMEYMEKAYEAGKERALGQAADDYWNNWRGN